MVVVTFNSIGSIRREQTWLLKKTLASSTNEDHQLSNVKNVSKIIDGRCALQEDVTSRIVVIVVC